MPRVPTAAAATASPRAPKAAPLDRAASLRAMLGVFLKDKKPAEVEMKAEGYGVYSIKGGKGTALEVYVGIDEQKKLPSAMQHTSRLYIDESNKKFYAQSWGKTVGPFALPKGVSWSSLLEPTTHQPKGVDEKAVAAVAAHVRADLGAANIQGRTRVDASKRGYEHIYINDPSGVIPGGALIITKDKMWIEMIPGISGDCIGPFTLPKGYTKDTLIAALDSRPAPAKPEKPTTPDLPNRDRRYVGGGSGSWGGGGGGRTSGLSPLSVRFGGGGGVGS